jgi:hypothetical protein
MFGVNMRLESKEPDIVRHLKRATKEQQRHAAIAVAEWALHQNELGDGEFAFIANDIGLNGVISPDDKVKLKGLVEQFDGEYFQTQDDGAARAECLDKFGKARAISALLVAGNDDAFAAAAESIYEALVSTQNESQLLDLVHTLLPK